MKKISVTLLFAIFFLTPLGMAEARSGCCSHHGGVCGCGCCDGSSLSAKCAPYYPECSDTPATTYRTADTCSVDGLYAAYLAHRARGEQMSGLSSKTWWKKCPTNVKQAVYQLLHWACASDWKFFPNFFRTYDTRVPSNWASPSMEPNWVWLIELPIPIGVSMLYIWIKSSQNKLRKYPRVGEKNHWVK